MWDKLRIMRAVEWVAVPRGSFPLQMKLIWTRCAIAATGSIFFFPLLADVDVLDVLAYAIEVHLYVDADR